MVTNGYARVGWALAQFQAGQLLGSDRLSYAFDGYLVCNQPNVLLGRKTLCYVYKL